MDLTSACQPLFSDAIALWGHCLYPNNLRILPKKLIFAIDRQSNIDFIRHLIR
ncbi:MAG: hypothetical protein JGK17_10380 [Microcoleus sp. PH2017_10_PVI_O_A]|uniref:hypothetical protein n=1 Tax=unclassified Microcoleus TaxID=2642155 RepID=UPI001D4413D9|nr:MULTISPECIES: hypothetical protein [unclassified Microcoleus]MCC3405979.1 hypothetical protein [Microcoleus sp. PH2017_10_PVI_O_A]MCC3459930.1 hypothetical protein [Microcoleus sp. PH2017_11_PCY_U_A]MCC3478445.1 hypothetical protein [Microcoleus sp. PH2017_12_PCY_D_A]MCC3527905.1 hypothetical protein [Microcoleus sp. PH2017_21_RUC_O_A]MCC3540001.1 hypothetical protein [Microcoleus sp. PH2017_22_RUC_O_B]